MSSPARMSAELSQQILDDLPFGVWVGHATTGKPVYSNRQAERIFGGPLPTDTGSGQFAATHGLQDRSGRPYPEDQMPFTRAVRERKTVVVDDLVLARADGTRTYLRSVAQPLFDLRGELLYVVAVTSDISTQLEAERAVRETRDRLQIALHHAPIILYTTALDGTITMSEGAGLAGLGFTSGQLVGQNIFDLYRDVPEPRENTMRALAGETFTTVTELAATALETWMGPLHDDAGAQIGMIGISTDITERLSLQRQVAHADRMSVLGRLAASIGHEINNPLAYSIEALRLARELRDQLASSLQQGDSSRTAQPLERLERLLADSADGLERVRYIARDLKAFAHPEDRRGPVRLDDAIQTAVRFARRRTDSRTRVELDLRAQAVVRADENRLVQIFTNLLLNAADALAEGEGTRNLVRVSSRREGDSAVVEVADNGPGIADSMRAHLFEPFFTSKSVGEGTGLGLYVTRGLLDALGATIEAGRAPEGGALFTVRIPVIGVAAGAADDAASAPSAAQRKRVLIIDDEPMITRLFRAALEDECEVEVAHSGRSALEHLLTGARYDKIFCDLMMADFGGAELYAELKKRAPGREKELIFMTGGVYDPEVAQFLSEIDNRCVDKPFDIRQEVLGS